LRASDAEKFDNIAKNVQDKFVSLNSMLQESTKERISELLAISAGLQESNTANWKAREEYKTVAEAKNKSLNYLLERASDAKAEFSEDGTRIEAKGKDGKAKKK
jgi:hypothetical protein